MYIQLQPNTAAFFMEHYLYHFKEVDDRAREVLIAVLSDLQFNGFEELDQSLLAYIAVQDAEQLSDTVIKQLGYPYSVRLVEPRNWNAEWEQSFQPVRIPDDENVQPEIYIHADFHTPHPQATYNISITPKMSFGTGHHQTTYLMMEEMLQMNFSEKEVIDFGTGTGVLAILAAKLGCQRVWAIDYDIWCIENARENIADNHTQQIELQQSDVFTAIPADIILANINLNVITEHLSTMLNSLKPNGVLLLSGMLLQDENFIVKTLQSYNINDITVKHRGNWILVRINKD